MQINLLTSDWDDYALLDAGNRLKLERFGEVTLIRSEPKAWWKPGLPESAWEQAQARYDDKAGVWRRQPGCPGSWEIGYGGIRFECRLTNGSKHLGVFPEQHPHWEFIRAHTGPGGAESVLNLFGYTGAATLTAAACGARVTHCDASKPAIAWGRSNQERSGLANREVRWILDDALKFVQREARRGRQYDAILLDPPSFGRGPKQEIWKVEEGIVTLLENCRALLSPRARYLLLTLYNLEASSLMLGNLLASVFGSQSGTIEVGELAQRQQSTQGLLPLSLYGRWRAG